MRNGEPRAVLVQNVARTSLVTCFVPILMVSDLLSPPPSPAPAPSHSPLMVGQAITPSTDEPTPSLILPSLTVAQVGGVVTAYNRTNRATDTVQEKFALYFTSCVALYPASRVLNWVETFAPLWLGQLTAISHHLPSPPYVHMHLARPARRREPRRVA